MTPRLPRITIRLLMALVVLAAGIAGLRAWSERWSERSARRRVEAAQHAGRAMFWSALAKLRLDDWIAIGGSWALHDDGTTELAISWDWQPAPGQGPQEVLRDWEEAVQDFRDRAAHHLRMRRAWLESARRLWSGEPIEPPCPPIRSTRLRIEIE